jgi:RsmE family RNA methyltransferase
VNVVLLEPAEVDAAGAAEVGGRRLEHVASVLRKGVGDTLRVGVVGGELGEGTVEAIDRGRMRLRCRFGQAPPPKRSLTLVLALPRPPVLRRTLQHVTAMGVQRIVLLHTRRVEKSYWGSPALQHDAVREQLLLGLEQAVDTVLPAVAREPRFRPFVEDRLAGRVLVADPSATTPCPVDVVEPLTLVVGPEGGLIPHELELLRAAGAELVGLGPRVLRVETAVVALLARLGLGCAL